MAGRLSFLATLGIARSLEHESLRRVPDRRSVRRYLLPLQKGDDTLVTHSNEAQSCSWIDRRNTYDRTAIANEGCVRDGKGEVAKEVSNCDAGRVNYDLQTKRRVGPLG